MRTEIAVASFIPGLVLFCTNHPGILLVVIGVAGEILLEWGKEKGTRGKLIRFFGLVLVVGLLLEIWEAVKSDEQVAELMKSNLGLAAELEETKRNQARIEPENLPITSVRANALLFVKGTNVWPRPDPVKDNHLVTFSVGNRDWVHKNRLEKLLLVCKAYERYGGTDEMEWVLEFGPEAMPSPLGPAWNLTTNDTVRSADEWDLLILRASFLHNKSQITRGSLSLVINTTVKQFPIPPQVAEMQFGEWGESRLVGSAASNAFNVIVIPGP
jgi:hypothetical protein